MHSRSPTLQKFKRKWYNIFWWVLLIMVFLYFLFRNAAKSNTVNENTSENLQKEKLKEENKLEESKFLITDAGIPSESVLTQTETAFLVEETSEQETSTKTITLKLHLPKPKVTEDVEILLSPKINRNVSCGPHGKSPSVLIFVLTTADAVSQRNAIRSSWGLPTNSHTRFINSRPYLFKVIFVMGRPAAFYLRKSSLQKEIEEEFEESGDILQLDLEDSKYEYTRKTKNALKWINKESTFQISQCKPRFVLKVLDDVFINFPAFLHWLDAKYNSSVIHSNSNLYIGDLIHKDKPIRDQNHPLHVSLDDYPDNFFPDYIRSPIFLLSWSTALSFTKRINSVRPIAMEDAYIGLLAYKYGIKPKHNEHFVLIGRPDNVCHHLRMFFIGSVLPMEQINTFKRQRHARDLPECLGMLPYNLDEENSRLMNGDL